MSDLKLIEVPTSSGTFVFYEHPGNQLVGEFVVELPLIWGDYGDLSGPGWTIRKRNGKVTLTLDEEYAWNGASGPTWDTRNTFVASAIHDALYRAMKTDQAPLRFRRSADRVFRRMLKEQGMGAFRSWYWYHGVRWKGREYADPNA